ncbi:hypothetical protein G6F22_021389 [Rhizopus arrhizus]|uniref:Uncharacterized protein n=1 Tax=Rhizopus delemar TaxID=936053 RepID=A0A9P7BZM1_9FUNG|nr:hypothetical protein G6F24_014779 [Rhizopus arrhizus]KAG0753589.1 hypothetical protein G6F22_021389 [Rhizopus arrhizus]KAG1260134.1 hypothetical protein G6F65_015127 [Rhizopus arrhizus]KAG1529649.1 hypothetical protein G6F50_017859 [Rhizopus delemar]
MAQDGGQCRRATAVIGVLAHHVAVAPLLHALHFLLQQGAIGQYPAEAHLARPRRVDAQQQQARQQPG